MVIDPDNSIDEVHENNNVGWISLQDSQETAVIDHRVNSMGNLELYQNYPNPFNGTGNIDYYLNRADDITLRIYDVTGKLLKSYAQGSMGSGIHTVEIDGTNFKTGVYYYTIQGKSSGSKTGKMLVIH